MKQDIARAEARRSIRLLFVESALTRAAFVMPVVYLLWTNALGMDQWRIGVLQAVFAGTMLVLQFPTGYFADRISHKLSNTIGDALLVIGMAVYFYAGSFWDAVLAEVFLGIGYSFSSGADSALLKKHAQTAGYDYHKLNSRLVSAGLVVAAITSVLGGVLGEESVRLAFAIEGGVMLIAFMLSLLIKDSGVRHKTHDRMLLGMIKVASQLNKNIVLLRRMLLSAALTSSTMMLVWFLTPMFFEVGIALSYQGIFFALISVFAIAGSEFASSRRGRAWRLSFPLVLVGVTYVILGVSLSVWTFMIFLVSSFARGVNSAKVAPAIQEVAPPQLHASSLSMFNVFYRIFTVIGMLTINWIGNIDIRYGLISAGVIAIVAWIFFRSWSE